MLAPSRASVAAPARRCPVGAAVEGVAAAGRGVTAGTSNTGVTVAWAGLMIGSATSNGSACNACWFLMRLRRTDQASASSRRTSNRPAIIVVHGRSSSCGGATGAGAAAGVTGSVFCTGALVAAGAGAGREANAFISASCVCNSMICLSLPDSSAVICWTCCFNSSTDLDSCWFSIAVAVNCSAALGADGAG